MISPQDCAVAPALFMPDRIVPEPQPDRGAIYGQASPRSSETIAEPLVEIHYYHLWSKDCGRIGHPLDAEHVSVLIQHRSNDADAGQWRALYWYAAAHENTVCDASQIARASALQAQDHGPIVWISKGKHASFLNEELCSHGCGGDICERMVPVGPTEIINLGERAAPMNGAVWAASPQWPLAIKLARADFAPASLARLEQLPDSSIAWANSSNHPAQGTIAVANTTAGALATSNQKTDSAVSAAGDATGNALNTSYRNVTRSLHKSARNVGKFLHTDRPPKPADKAPAPNKTN
jgi:hypothetical protein